MLFGPPNEKWPKSITKAAGAGGYRKMWIKRCQAGAEEWPQPDKSIIDFLRFARAAPHFLLDRREGESLGQSLSQKSAPVPWRRKCT